MSGSLFLNPELQLFPSQVEDTSDFPSESPNGRQEIQWVPQFGAMGVGDVLTVHEYEYLKEKLSLETMSLTKLYRQNYIPLVHQMKERRLFAARELGHAPLYFANPAESKFTDLSNSLRRMTNFFRNKEPVSPSPYDLIAFQVEQEMEDVAKLFESIDQQVVGRSLKPSGEDEDRMWESQLSGDSLLLAVNLSNIDMQSVESLRIMLDKLRKSKHIALELPVQLVRHLLRHFDNILNDNKILEWKRLFSSLVGLVVSLRAELLDVLWLLRSLESFQTSELFHCVLPYASEVVSSLALNAEFSTLRSSPIDCIQEEPVPMLLSVKKKEGFLSAMCVSPDGALIAATIGSQIVLINRGTGSVIRREELSEELKSSWVISFTDDAQYILITDATGHHHAVLSVELHNLFREETKQPCISLDWSNSDSKLKCSEAPFLPAGSSSSLYLYQNGVGVKKEFKNYTELHRFSLGVFITTDYEGLVTTVETESGVLCATIHDHVLILSAYGHTCRAALSSTKWAQLHIQWHKGRWIVLQNGIFLQLQGMNQLPPSTLRVHSTTIFEGRGHIASIALWSSPDDQQEMYSASCFFSRELHLSASNLFFYYPLDEGMGFWLKDLATRRSDALSATKCYVWDRECCCPTPPRTYPPVQMPHHEFLSRRALISTYHIYLLPPLVSQAERGSTTVTKVNCKTNTIERLYQCSPTGLKKFYALRKDEAELIVCEPSFLAFTSVRLYSKSPVYHSLSAGKSETPPNSLQWVLEELCKKVYIFGTELAHEKLSSFSLEDFDGLLTQLSSVTSKTTPIFVRSLLSVSLAYFQAISLGKLTIPVRDYCFQASLSRIISMFENHATVKEPAVQLLQVAERSLCTMKKKCSFFLEVPSKNWDVYFEMFSDIPLIMIVNYAIDNGKERDLVSMTVSMFQQFQSSSMHPKLAHWVTQHVLVTMHALLSRKRESTLTELMTLICNFASESLETWRSATFSLHRPSQSIVVTGVVPLLIGVSRKCPHIVNSHCAENLVNLIRRIQKISVSIEEALSFDSTTVYELRPPNSGKNKNTWCFVADFSEADKVFIQKDRQAPPFSILSQGRRKLDSTIANVVATEVSVSGDILVFSGQDDVNIATTANYTFKVNSCWMTLLLQCFEDVLLSLTRSLWFCISPVQEFKIPLAFRHGLTTEALKLNNINIPDREAISTYSAEILNGTGKGKELTDSVCHSMRGSIIPSMKPAIQSLLAILIHCGATEHEAEKELRLNWFSGNWGISFQGPQRGPVLKKLEEIAHWVVGNIHFDRSLPTSLSRSFSRVSLTASSFHTTVFHFSVMKDLLDSVRSALCRPDGIEVMKATLIHQTRRALNFCRGVDILYGLVSAVGDNVLSISKVLKLVLDYTGECGEQHVVESIFGAGLEMESRVRVSFNSLLKQLTHTLIKNDKNVFPDNTLDLIGASLPTGLSILSVLTLFAYPWESDDYQLMIAEGERAPDGTHCPWMLKTLAQLMRIPFNEVLHGNTNNYAGIMGFHESWKDAALKINESIAAVSIRTIGIPTENHFSVALPQVVVMDSKSGPIVIRKNSEARLFLRADDPWNTFLEQGSPCIHYFEVHLNTQCPDAMFFGLTSGDASFEEASSRFVFALSTEGKLFPSTSELQEDYIPFRFGDVLGCGFNVALRKVFYTRNGVFWRAAGTVPEAEKKLFPSLLFGESSGVEIDVNFGTSPFVFDYSQMHPSLSCSDGPTWYNLFFVAETVSYFLTAQACSSEHKEEDGDIQLFKKFCCDAACEHINVVASSLLNMATAVEKDSAAHLRQAVMFRIGESSLLLQISTLRKVFLPENIGKPVPEVISSTVYDAVSLVMTLPLQSTLIATLRLLRDVITEINSLSEGNSIALVKTLFIHAEKEDTEVPQIPFRPSWETCDPHNVAILSNTFAAMLPKSKVSVILGGTLPSSGEVSFSVSIQKRGSPKGRSLQSGYYIGIAQRNAYPTDLLQSWKTKQPPTVWALHDVSPQLPHATNPSVEPNSFMRAFGSAESVKVVVNRDRGTVSFFRDGKFLSTLFLDLPSSIEVVPFVQLYNEDASVFLDSGLMTSPITETMLLSAVSVDVLRCMLRVSKFDMIVSKYLRKEMSRKTNPKVTFAIFNGVPDPRCLEIGNKEGKNDVVQILDIEHTRYKYISSGSVFFENAYKFRIPTRAQVDCRFDVEPQDNLNGIGLCIEGLVNSLYSHTRLTTVLHSLLLTEIQCRSSIINEEERLFDILRGSLRIGLYNAIRLISQDLLSFNVPDADFVFSSALSNPAMQISAQYLGKLVRLQSNAPVLSTFISIADPVLPDKGVCNLCCRIRRNDDSHTLGGGYYFGICTENFSWKCTDFARREDSRPQVWALHDADSPVWRLKHMKADVSFEDNISFFSGDTIRLCIDRDAGTMDAYRKPYKGDEIFLGRLFDNVSVEPLRPFVCLYNNDASAVLLSTTSDRVPLRVTRPQTHFATFDYSQKIFCSSCSMNQLEEVQLSDDWYKCNECVNYALCPDCFYRCIHPHHSFSAMNSKRATAYTISPPWKVSVGMNLFIPSGPAMYLRSSDCRLPEDELECVAVANSAEESFALWGLLGNCGRFVVSVDTEDGKPISSDGPVFVGITSNEDVLSMSPAEFRTYMLNYSGTKRDGEVVLVCSDPFIDEKGGTSSSSGFTNGCTITFCVDIRKRIVEVSKDWVIHRRANFTTKKKYIKETHLFFFVLFGSIGQKVTIFPDRSRTTAAVVTEVNGNIITMNVPRFGNRIVAKDQCRAPLVPFHFLSNVPSVSENSPSTPNMGLIRYFFDDKILTQGIIQSSADGEAHILVGGVSKCLPLNKLLVDPYMTRTTLQRQLNSSPLLLGPSLSSGLSIFKILLILSCMCQNTILSSVVTHYKSVLLSVVQSLSSASLSSCAPSPVISKIRSMLQHPQLWFRVSHAAEFLPYLVIPIPAKKEKSFSQEALVWLTGDARDLIYRVKEKKRNTVTLGDATGTQADIHAAIEDCVEIQQSCESTSWCEIPNGLPASKREYTLRRMLKNPAELATIEGSWRGEITSKKASFKMDLNLEKEGTFQSESSVQFLYEVRKFLVYYDYHRYDRVARMIMLDEEQYSFWKTVKNLKWTEIISSIDEKKLPSECVYVIKGVIDCSGMQFSGTYRFPDGTMGSVFARLLTRVPLRNERSEDVAVLPDCEKTEKSYFYKEPDRGSSVSNLIILLSRHLYLMICHETAADFGFFAERIELFHRHPLAIDMTNKLSFNHILLLTSRAAKLIISPSVHAEDASSLAKFVLAALRHPSLTNAGPHFIWDSLHSVVFAAHKCSPKLRPEILSLLGSYISNRNTLDFSHNYFSLLAALFSFASAELDGNTRTQNHQGRQDASAIVELLLDLPVEIPYVGLLENIPVNALKCLLDIRSSMENKRSLPSVVDGDVKKGNKQTAIKCLFGELVDRNFLKIGKAVGEAEVPRKKVYFEVVLSKDDIGTYAIGWGTEQHRRASDTHVGTDAYSFAFLGSMITFGGNQQIYEIPSSLFFGMKQQTVIGCLLDLANGKVAWSRNGIVGRWVPIPGNHLGRDPLYAFASINGGSGLSILLNAEEFLYAPPEYYDLSDTQCGMVTGTYKPLERSTVPPQPKEFYVQLSAYLSLRDNSRSTREFPNPNIRDFHLLSCISATDLLRYERIIRVIENVVGTAEHFLDLECEKVTGKLSTAFLFFKPMLREFSRLRMIHFDPIVTVAAPKDIVIRMSAAPAPDATLDGWDFLSHTALYQCYKQLKDIPDEIWSTAPLFRVRLYLSGSGHFPIDMGGPYRQTWSIISQELMQLPVHAPSNPDNNRLSLFRFCNNSMRISLVPDETMNTPALLSMFTFVGRLMGYAAKAQMPLDIELSPFVWKFLGDDELSVEDYYMYVDSVVRSSMRDSDFFANGMAEELIFGLSEQMSSVNFDGLSSEEVLAKKQDLAEDCLLHSMDLQLQAIKIGVWKVLSRRVLRCLYWKDLEELVCGVANPSVKDLRKFIKCNLTHERQSFFWEILEDMTPEQKSSLLCFASGQRRLPLIRPISVEENAESENHLPRAQSCSSLITIPQYSSKEVFKEKLLTALQHQNEMELA